MIGWAESRSTAPSRSTAALDAGCVDELILTVAPVLLGEGVPLYQGKRLQRFDAEHLGSFGSMMQVRLTTAE